MPLSDADLKAKLDELAGPVLGADRLRQVAERLWTLDQAADLDGL
jgi:hypothetical protein